MQREKLKIILEKYYSKDSIKSVLSGRMRPSYEVMLKLNTLHNIPFVAWQDIKSYMKSVSEVENKN